MATAQGARSGQNGAHHNSGSRKNSFSSFPPSRSPSYASLHNGMAKFRLGAHRGGDSSDSVNTDQSASVYDDGHIPPQRHVRKLKSQYPLDSPERHVEYILVASFDIDRGPIMEHQFPGAISGDENMLAELMLPDQTHIRSQDWTIFFLHKDTAYEEEKEAREEAKAERRQWREQREQRRQEREAAAANGDHAEQPAESEDESSEEEEEEEEEEGEDDDDEGGEGPPLIYVLNLVNTKQDSTVKRGAVVKAMAICTRHPFLHIYKPLLLLALEEYFRSPVPETLELLYNAVNNMDLSLMPKLSILERHILQGSETKDMFVEKFEQMIQQRMLEDAAHGDDTQSPSRADLSRKIGHFRDTHEYETRVVYNSIPIPIKVPTAVTPETVGDFSIVKLISTFSGPHATQPQPFALHPHLTTSGAYTHPIIVLVNAILTQKRIIFLGHNRPSGEVAEAVLAACALVSGSILRGFTRHAFPYTDLSKIDSLLNVPGFIAGVTNPVFANQFEWWDLLCDLPSGRIKISNRIESAPPTEGLVAFQQQHPGFAPSTSGIIPGPGANSSDPRVADPTGDNTFMEEISRCITARHGEAAIRSRWRDYILRFTRIAAAFEESVYGASALYIGAAEADAGAYGVSGHGHVWLDETLRARELGANVWRIEGWRNTRSYYAFIQDLAALWGRKPIRSLDLQYQVDRLKILKLSREDSGRIFLALEEAVQGYDEICQLLAVTPENHGGLFYLGLGLFHPDRTVRDAVCRLLDRIRAHEAGRHFWTGLGRFAKSAFFRMRSDNPAGDTAEGGMPGDEEDENGAR